MSLSMANTASRSVTPCKYRLRQRFSLPLIYSEIYVGDANTLREYVEASYRYDIRGRRVCNVILTKKPGILIAYYGMLITSKGLPLAFPHWLIYYLALDTLSAAIDFSIIVEASIQISAAEKRSRPALSLHKAA